MKGFKRVKMKGRKDELKAMFKPGTVTMLNIRHDNNCGFWRRSDMADCNCVPDLEPVTVTEENAMDVAKTFVVDEAAAQKLRELAQRRN